MRTSCDDYSLRNQYGWDTTPNSYSAQVRRTERMPAAVLIDGPQYPDQGHVIVSKVTYEEDGLGSHGLKHHHHYPTPKIQEKVEVIEYERVDGLGRNGRCEVYEVESIDMEADGYIQKKHRSYDVPKYNTYKGY